MADITRQWKGELAQHFQGGRDVFAPDAQVHVIQVNLRDAPDLVQRRKLLQVPTALTIPDQDVTQLIDAGRTILRESPEFKALMQALTEGAAAKP